MKDKVSGAIAIPKASWGCAPSLPNRIRVVFLKQAAGSEIPVPHFWHTERVVRKATAFRGGANKTASSCETWIKNMYLVTVPGEQLQRNITLQKILLLGKTVFSIRQKGVPSLLLPASVPQSPRCFVRICNLFHKEISIMNWKVLKNAIAAGKPCYKDNLLRKCGLLAHTSPTFLKNCWIKKLFIACGSFFAAMIK